MEERTTADVAQIYKAAGHSVSLINSISNQATITDENKDTLKRNVRHLEIIKAYKKLDGTTSIWTTEDFGDIDAAVTLGKSKY